MKYIYIILFTLLTTLAFSQGAGIQYMDTIPTHHPDASLRHSTLVRDLTNDQLYNYEDSIWKRVTNETEIVYGIDSVQQLASMDSLVDFKLGDRVVNRTTGATYIIQTSEPAAHPTDGLAVVAVDTNYAVLTGSPLQPKWFGAVGDDVTDDAAAIQAMFDYGENMRMPHFDFGGMSYYLAAGVILPDSFPGISTWMRIDGNGANLRTDQDITMFSRIPVSDADDARLIDNNFPTISRFTFDGDGTSGSIGIYLGATYNAVVEDCQFITLDTAIITAFSLNGNYRGLRFTNCMTRNFVGTNGTAWGASAGGSAFNANKIENCRVFFVDGALSGFHLESADQNYIEGCITEGFTPLNEIYISTELTVTKQNHIINHWSETSVDTNTIIFWEQGAGTLLYVDNLQSNTPDTVAIIDGSLSTGRIVFKNASLNGTHFYGNRIGGVPSQFGASWFFDGVNPNTSSNIPSPRITDVNRWDGAILPKTVLENQFRSENGGNRYTTNIGSKHIQSYLGHIYLNTDFDNSGTNIYLDSDLNIHLQPDLSVLMEQDDGDDVFEFQVNTGDATFGSSTLDAQLFMEYTSNSSSAETGLPIVLRNLDLTNNNHANIGFSDGDAVSAVLTSQFSDHVNNYGNFEFWTREADGFNERMNIDAAGDVAMNHNLDVALESRLGGIADQGAYNLQVEGDSYYNGGLTLAGATSGTTEIVATAVAGTTTATLQAVTGTIALLGDLATTATESAEGIVELATVAELDAGTDVSRVPNVNNLAGSDFGTKDLQIEMFAANVAVSTGDGNFAVTIPASLDGYDLVNAVASVHDKGITGTTDITIERWRAGAAVDMLSTAITIGDEWFAQDGSINTANDDVITGDRIYINVDVIHTTPPNGLSVVLEFRKP